MSSGGILDTLKHWRTGDGPYLPLFAARLRHAVYAAFGCPVIIVYTMGKVGSTAVFHALRRNPVSPLTYQAHVLTESGTRRQIEKYARIGDHARYRVTPGQLLRGSFSRLTASRILAGKPPRRWYLISMVRDPVATHLSHVFEKPQIHRPALLAANGRLDRQKVEAHVRDLFENFDEGTDYVANWFGREFRTFTGIDVYQHGFDRESGYGLIRNDAFHVLIVALDRLDAVFPSALSELIGGENRIEIVRRNQRERGQEAPLYEEIKDWIRLPPAILDRVYATRYARHFFSAAALSAMRGRWAADRA